MTLRADESQSTSSIWLCGMINTNLFGVSGREFANRFISLVGWGLWRWFGDVGIVIGEFDFGGVHREPSFLLVSIEVCLICLLLFSINIFCFLLIEGLKGGEGVFKRLLDWVWRTLINFGCFGIMRPSLLCWWLWDRFVQAINPWSYRSTLHAEIVLPWFIVGPLQCNAAWALFQSPQHPKSDWLYGNVSNPMFSVNRCWVERSEEWNRL